MEIIKKYEWFVIWRSTCPHSRMAVETLKKIGKPAIISIDILGTPENVKKFLDTHANGITTVPVIFHNGVFIGGNDDLQRLRQ